MKKITPNIKVHDKVRLSHHKEVVSAVRDKVMKTKHSFKVKGY